MTILILGPNGSGKSAYAEELVLGLSAGVHYYIATMIPYGEEGLARVEKHRKQRKDMGFLTVEKPTKVSDVTLPADAAALLEDVSNLLGNALFTGERDGNGVFADITALCKKCRVVVLVSIDGLSERSGYDEETRVYIERLNRLNEKLIGFADVVIVMRDGIPVFVKGETNALD